MYSCRKRQTIRKVRLRKDPKEIVFWNEGVFHNKLRFLMQQCQTRVSYSIYTTHTKVIYYYPLVMFPPVHSQRNISRIPYPEILRYSIPRDIGHAVHSPHSHLVINWIFFILFRIVIGAENELVKRNMHSAFGTAINCNCHEVVTR